MASSSNNIIINPVNVLWQIEASELLDFTGIVSTTLDGVYFTINSAKDATEYYVWFNLDAGSVDPAPAGKTAIPVAVTTGDSPATIATATQTAIDALGDFSASVVESVKVSVKRAAVGEVTDTADVDSGVGVTICRRGKDFDLGLLQGDVEPTFAPANFVVQAQQTGLTPLALLNQGFETLEATTVLQETGKSQLKELYKIYGGAFTPGAGTEVFGAGLAALGKNLLVDGARLVFRPVNTISDELSYDYNFMLALPIPDTLTFSGENPRVLSVTWSGFVDESIDSRVNAVLVGDASQAGLSV